MLRTVKVGLVYKATCIVSGHSYIGKTMRSKQQRWAEHVNAATAGVPGALYNALRKHGEETFKVRRLRFATEPFLDYFERYYISKYDSFRNGYNMTAGGDGVTMDAAMRRKLRRAALRKHAACPELARKHSELMRGHKQRRSTIVRRNAALRGQLRSDEFCERMSDVMRGKRKSALHCQNLSVAQNRRFSDVTSRLARSAEQRLKWQDDAYRARMVAAHTGVKQSEATKAKRKATWAAKRKDAKRIEL